MVHKVTPTFKSSLATTHAVAEASLSLLPLACRSGDVQLVQRLVHTNQCLAGTSADVFRSLLVDVALTVNTARQLELANVITTHSSHFNPASAVAYSLRQSIPSEHQGAAFAIDLWRFEFIHACLVACFAVSNSREWLIARESPHVYRISHVCRPTLAWRSLPSHDLPLSPMMIDADARVSLRGDRLQILPTTNHSFFIAVLSELTPFVTWPWPLIRLVFSYAFYPHPSDELETDSQASTALTSAQCLILSECFSTGFAGLIDLELAKAWRERAGHAPLTTEQVVYDFAISAIGDDSYNDAYM